MQQALLILMLTVSLYSKTALAQDTIIPRQPFVKLTSGTVIKGENLLHTDVNVILDGRTFSNTEISFFEDNAGTIYAVFDGKPSATLVSGNNVNVFKVPVMHSSFRGNGTSQTSIPYPYTSFEIAYSKNLQELKGLKIKHVETDMSDNPVSKKYISKAKGSRVGIGISIGFMAAGFIFSQYSLWKTDNMVGVVGGIGISLGGGIAVNLFTKKKKALLKQAISAYTGKDF